MLQVSAPLSSSVSQTHLRCNRYLFSTHLHEPPGMGLQRAVTTRREQRSRRRTHALSACFNGGVRLKRSPKAKPPFANRWRKRFVNLKWYSSSAFVRSEERRRWHDQFYQIKARHKISGVGCGWCVLETQKVPCQYPFVSEMNIAIWDGGSGNGGIQMSGRHDQWEEEDVFGSGKKSATILFPTRHIGM